MADVLHSAQSIVGGHAAATTAVAGFQSAADKLISSSLSPLQGVRWFVDFSAGTSAGEENWIANQVGGSITQLNTNQDASHFGTITLSTTTSATGRASLSKCANTAATMTFGSANTLLCEMWVRFPAISDGTETFAINIGMFDLLTTKDSNNGAYFQVDSNANANFQCVTGNAGTRTTTASATVIAANTWYRLTIEKASGANAYTFKVDGVAVVSNQSTNAPSGAIGPAVLIIKAVGTTARTLIFDGSYGHVLFDAARYA